jgi:6-phosphogluconate dehydrogenase (decarboxylating)
MELGIIGLGKMGGNMAERLLPRRPYGRRPWACVALCGV